MIRLHGLPKVNNYSTQKLGMKHKLSSLEFISPNVTNSAEVLILCLRLASFSSGNF